MMKKIIYTILVSIVLIGCSMNSQQVSPNQSVELISLKENYPALLDAAQKWDAEAYLQSANIPIFAKSDENYLWLVNALFQSPNKVFETLLVTLETDGKITSHLVPHELEVYQTIPISPTDWPIDSKDAFVFFQDSDVFGDLNIPTGRTSLFLERVLTERDQPLVWRLSINMSSTDGLHYHISAVDGEMLQFVR